MTQTIEPPMTVEAAVATLRKLSPRDRLKAITLALAETENELPEQPRPLKSLYGLWAGVSVSAEDIDEIRREMWANFPRDDI